MGRGLYPVRYVNDPFVQCSDAVVSGATSSHVLRVVRQTVNGEFRDPISLQRFDWAQL